METHTATEFVNLRNAILDILRSESPEKSFRATASVAKTRIECRPAGSQRKGDSDWKFVGYVEDATIENGEVKFA